MLYRYLPLLAVTASTATRSPSSAGDEGVGADPSAPGPSDPAAATLGRSGWRPLASFAGHCWRGLLLLVIAMAIVVGAARLSLPPLGEHLRPQLESWLAERLGMPVSIASLRLAWVGTGPALRLEGLRVQAEDGAPAPLELGRVIARIDLLQSLRSGLVQPSWLRFRGTRLIVQRSPSGALELRGGPGVGAAQGGVDGLAAEIALGWLRRLPRAQLVEGELTLLDSALPEGRITLRDLALTVDSQADGLQLGLDLRLPERYGGRVHLALHTPGGNPSELASWPLAGHLEAEQLAVHEIQALFQRPVVGQGRADLRLWAQSGDGRLVAASGTLALTDGLREASLRFSLEPTAAGWRISADQIGEQAVENEAASGALLAEVRVTAGEPQALRLAGQALPLPALALVAEHLPLDGAVGEALQRLQPRGLAESVSLSWEPAEAALPPRLTLDLRARDLSWRPDDKIPGVSNLALRVRGSAEHLQVLPSGSQVVLDYPRLFRGPLPGIDLGGELVLRHSGEGWSIASPDLRLGNADISAHARVYADGIGWSRPELLDLQVSFSGVPVDRVGHYYPVGIIKPKLLAWLDRSLVAGRVPAGVLLFRGDPAEYPYRQAEGTFLVRFGVEDAILDYHPAWPRAEELVGELSFSGTGFQGEVLSARLVDAQVASGTVGIARFRDAHLALALTAGPELESLRSYLDASPLAESLGRTVARLGAKGPATLELSLQLPLRKPDFSVAGTLRLAGAQIAVPDWDLQLSALQGPLSFSRDSLAASQLQARWRDLPVRLSADAKTRNGALAGSFSMSGESELAALVGDRLGPLAERVSGRGPWQARAILAAGAAPVLELESSLRGVAVDLPAPLGKRAAEDRPMRLRIAPGADGKAEIQLHLAELGEARARVADYRQAPTLEAASVQLGAGAAAPPPQHGLVVLGRLPSLDLGPWLALAGTAPAAAQQALALRRAELAVDQLTWGSWKIAGIQASADGDGWRLVADDDWLRGSISGEHGGGPIRASLERLWLSAGLPSAGGGPLDPRRFPALQVAVADLRFDDALLGAGELRTAPVPGGLTLEHLSVAGTHHRLTAQGAWELTGTQSSSRLNGEVVTTDLGGTVRELGLRSAIAGAPGRIAFDLSWPGALIAPPLGEIAGRLDLALSSGELKQLEPGVGRIFGLVNLNELGRRLALDFRDIQEKGFFFNAITGHFRIADGNAVTDDLRIAGPAARIEIAGRVGLVAQDYDQRAYVTPEIGSALPIAGVIAGGPLVGAALLIAGQLLKPGIDRVSRIEYRITGPWEAPLVEPVRLERAPRDPAVPRGDQ